MFNNFWFRKEKPFAGFAGFGGGVGSNLVAGPSGPAYTEATGGIISDYTDSGTHYRSHIFTSSGTFTVTQVANEAGGGATIEYLVVAGGGGGAVGSDFTTYQAGGGGGGAGGLLVSPSFPGVPTSQNQGTTTTVTAGPTTYTITVGAGGAVPTGAGNNGAASSITGS